MSVDLSSLPLPQSIEEISFEAILQRKIDKFQELWAAIRALHPELPDYDVAMLETDPIKIVLEEDAYDEMLLRALANNVLKSNLLAWSVGTDLDNLAADHGVTRLVGESDAALRSRIVLHDQGSSAAGPEAWYKFYARSASVRVKDVAVYRAGTGPNITLAILATDNGGVPDQPLLDAVYAAVNASSIRVISDVISVVASTSTTVNVNADIWLLPDTPMAIFTGLEAALRAAATTEGGIGFDINRSWLIAKLMVAGVSKVVLNTPASDAVIDANSAAVLGTVTLTMKGRSR